ncbi:MAG: hypothetical protein KDC46_09270 [Thermoleophilia bacterium]|nr:hypothetical protein [Thermoleophilia bacterium]
MTMLGATWPGRLWPEPAASGAASPILTGGGSPPTAAEQKQLDAMLAVLDETEHGKDVAAYLRANPQIVRVWDDAAYNRAFPGSGASFNPARQELNLPRSVLRGIDYGTTTVAHEAQHALDAPNRFGVITRGFANLAGSAIDGAGAAAHLHNPITGMLDGYADRELEWEVSAYRTQAEVAKELGQLEYGWNLGQNADGSVRSDEEIRAALRDEPLYRMAAGRRLMLGATGGALGVLGASLVVGSIAGRVRPGSYLARHSWPVLAAGGVALGTALLQDQVQYRSRS